jgi:tetratricopeptide (TPR) repeat protein
MKFNLKNTLLLIVLFAASSCQKFVDIKKSSAQNFIETANDCQLLLDNYDIFNVDYPIDGLISSDDYYMDDYRYNSDVILLDDRALYTWQSNAIRSSATTWVNAYNKIYHCNLVLESVETLKGKEAVSVLNNLRGTALFLRAYSLWNLAQLYAAPYSSANAKEAGLPVHLVSDINDVPGRGTVQQTYDAIVKDLEESVQLMPVSSSIASRPNKVAALAMLARVYLSMGDYANSSKAATAALELKSDLIDYSTLEVGTLTPFRRFNKEVIFHSIGYKQNSVLEPGYGDQDQALIPLDLINSYQPGDLRKEILFKENTDVPVPTGTFRFTGNYESAAGSSALFNGLAVDELYLTRAECYARTGNLSGALGDLNTLLKSRWNADLFQEQAATTADGALDLIIQERRKELVMRGTRWTDLRRLNMEPRFAKTLSRTVNAVIYTLPANDKRYTLLIPQEVITYSALSQNSR